MILEANQQTNSKLESGRLSQQLKSEVEMVTIWKLELENWFPFNLLYLLNHYRYVSLPTLILLVK